MITKEEAHKMTIQCNPHIRRILIDIETEINRAILLGKFNVEIPIGNLIKTFTIPRSQIISILQDNYGYTIEDGGNFINISWI